MILMTMHKVSIQLIFSVFLIFPTIVSAVCLKVDGLEFEGVSSYVFLVSKQGTNIGTMRMVFIPDARKARKFRFFTDVICDSGAENQLMIDGELRRIELIQLFKNFQK